MAEPVGLAGLFITAPYGKFVHAVYRCIALVQHRVEQDRDATTAE